MLLKGMFLPVIIKIYYHLIALVALFLTADAVTAYIQDIPYSTVGT